MTRPHRVVPGPILLLAAALAAAPACGPAPAPARPSAFGAVADAPWELEDESGWLEVRDQLLGLAIGDPRRRDLRIRLAAAQADRIERWLDENRPGLAHEAMLDLVRLWGDDPEAIGDELAARRAAIARARDVFARAGAAEETVLALVVLGELEPARRDERWAEIDEILAYSDEVAVALYGPHGVRARSVRLLEAVAFALPLPRVTDRFVELTAARQVAVADALVSSGATFELVRAHADVLRAARKIAAALARAGRAPEIAAWIEPMTGIGGDPDLAPVVAAIARPGATARDWARLARAFRATPDEDDPESARAAARAGLARFPADPTLLAAAGQAAADLRRVHEAIRLHEELRRRAPTDPEVADRLTTLYRDRLAALAFNDRPLDARARLGELEAFHAELVRAWPGRRWSSTLAEALSTVGRGLVAQGELDEAIALLERAVALAPDAEAHEMLATVALKRERWGEARRWAERGARLEGPAGVYGRAKLLKLAGDAAAGAGDGRGARAHWLASLGGWADLGDGIELPPPLQGERMVQGGQLLWALGDRDEALRLLEAAVDLDPDGADTHTQVVAFFLQQGEHVRALDAYHRALLADRIGDYHKVYMSLWLIADARRRGVEPDLLAIEYLERRDGALWHDEMARLATGRLDPPALARRARTRARKAELAYYTAVLGVGERGAALPAARVRALLEDVVATDMVLFFEYDMARHWLAASR